MKLRKSLVHPVALFLSCLDGTMQMPVDRWHFGSSCFLSLSCPFPFPRSQCATSCCLPYVPLPLTLRMDGSPCCHFPSNCERPTSLARPVRLKLRQCLTILVPLPRAPSLIRSMPVPAPPALHTTPLPFHLSDSTIATFGYACTSHTQAFSFASSPSSTRLWPPAAAARRGVT